MIIYILVFFETPRLNFRFSHASKIFYNNFMQRLWEMLGILAVLYAAYALTMGKWDYSSPQKRNERKTELKTEGLSTRFYFMHPRTQLVLTLMSGGLFTFYWLFRQWGQVLRGFKRLDGTPLKGNAFMRALGGGWTFFVLAGLINRTCEYMHKPTSWPSWLWGTMWWGGLVLVLCPVAIGWRIGGYLIWCLAPSIFQARINTLTSEKVSAFPRVLEIVVALLGTACVVGLIAAWRVWMK